MWAIPTTSRHPNGVNGPHQWTSTCRGVVTLRAFPHLNIMAAPLQHDEKGPNSTTESTGPW